MRKDITGENPFLYGKGTFALPDKNMDEILDFLEDMIMMTGCPGCGSLNTKMIYLDKSRILVCMDCGSSELLPPPS